MAANRVDVDNGCFKRRRIMSARSRFHRLIVAVVIAGILNPALQLQAEPAVRTRVPDVRLDEQGQFHGVVLNGQGQAMPDTQVKLARVNQQQTAAANMATVTTDARGSFVIRDLPAGTYRLETSSGVFLCRLWTHAAAPPSSASSLCVVNDPQVVRGQRPMHEIFRSDPLLMAAIVAAAIAIPIAVHKSQDDSPEGS
jgi:hypothetical protein